MKRTMFFVGLLLIFGAALVFALFGKASKPPPAASMPSKIHSNGGGMNGGNSNDVMRPSPSVRPTRPGALLAPIRQQGHKDSSSESGN